MRPPDQVVRDFVRQWLDKAGKDLEAAEVLLAGEMKDYESAAFHAQQAAEKFLKALLVRHQVVFPKSHEIRLLRGLVARVDRALADEVSAADALTPYGVEFRYPGDMEPVSRERAEGAVRLAEQVRDVALSRLKSYLAVLE